MAENQSVDQQSGLVAVGNHSCIMVFSRLSLFEATYIKALTQVPL